LGEIIRSMRSPERLGGDAHARILARLRMTEHGRKWEWLGVVPRPVFAGVVVVLIVFLGVGAQAGIGWIWKAGLSWVHERQRAAEPSERVAGPASSPRRELSLVVHPSPTLNLPPTAASPEEPARIAEAPALAPVDPPRAARAPLSPAPHARPRSEPRGSVAASARTEAAGPSLAAPDGLAVVPLAPPLPAAPAPSVAAPAASAAHAIADTSPLAQESRLLATALDQLRIDRDYNGALTTLSEYDSRFPRGVLRSEAKLARLDALMGLGSSAAALHLLDGIEIGGPRALEVLVLRGELRANARRYQEAIRDFNQVLTHDAPERFHERALYGRASCFSRLGDMPAATRDQREYLDRFPGGSHASEIRQNLNP
jgi:hypothetical protein